MKTTADLPLTEYQRGQLAHYRCLMRLANQGSTDDEIGPVQVDEPEKLINAVKTHQKDNDDTSSKNPRNIAPKVLTFSDARDILIASINGLKAEELNCAKRGSPSLHRLSARKGHARGNERRRSLLPGEGGPKDTYSQSPNAKKKIKLTPNLDAATTRAPVIDLTLFGFEKNNKNPGERKILKIPEAKPAEPQELWKEEADVVPKQLLAMTAYSEARSDVEQKEARLGSLVAKLAESDVDPLTLQQLKEEVDKLKPQLQVAMERLGHAEARLKVIAGRTK